MKNLYLPCSEVSLLKICFQHCDNKWLGCSLKSGQPLCKGGKTASLKCMKRETMDYSIDHARDEQITEGQAHKGGRLMKNK